MKFSIIIPAYNASGHIRKALESIRVQSFTDYELIVVCDSCTDDTEAIARAYGAQTKAVDFHRDGLTRNAGLDMASGEWILFLDDDDWLLHEFVLSQLAVKTSQIDCDIIAFAFIWKHQGYAPPRRGGIRGGGYFWPAVWNKCYRRDFIGDTRFNSKWSVSDLDFTNALFAKHPRIQVWDMPLYYYNYMRPGSITEQDRGKHDQNGT